MQLQQLAAQLGVLFQRVLSHDVAAKIRRIEVPVVLQHHEALVGHLPVGGGHDDGIHLAPAVAAGAAVVLIAGGAFAFANRGGGENVVNIATKPMTEQYILGEMLNTLIEHDTDLKVELTQGVGGGTSNIEPGMEKGDFDLYPEYTGTGWNAVLKHDDTYDESMFDTMQQEYE